MKISKITIGMIGAATIGGSSFLAFANSTSIPPIFKENKIIAKYDEKAGGSLNILKEEKLQNIDDLTQIGTITESLRGAEKYNTSEQTYFTISNNNSIITHTETPAGKYNFEYEVCHLGAIPNEEEPELPSFTTITPPIVIFPPIDISWPTPR